MSSEQVKALRNERQLKLQQAREYYINHKVDAEHDDPPEVEDLADMFDLEEELLLRVMFKENWSAKRNLKRDRFLTTYENTLDQALQNVATNQANEMAKTIHTSIAAFNTHVPRILDRLEASIDTMDVSELMKYLDLLNKDRIAAARLVQAMASAMTDRGTADALMAKLDEALKGVDNKHAVVQAAEGKVVDAKFEDEKSAALGGMDGRG